MPGLNLEHTFKTVSPRLMESAKDLICYAIIYAVALYGSLPLFSSSSPVPPGFDSVMHLSKVRVFSQFFPSVPKWFPWWYCGAPSLRFYPPLSYLVATSVSWLFQASALEAYQFTDFFSFFLAGLFMHLFMRRVSGSRFAGVSSAVLYMLSPQTLYGRFFVGQFTHNFSMFLIPLTLYCIAKYGNDVKRTALVTAPLFALLFLSHYQTALSFGFMLGIYIFISLFIGRRKGQLEHARTRTLGLFLGGALGIFLACFWLLPSLMEGFGQLGLTREAALKTMVPVESLFVEAKYLRYLQPIQQLWCEQYFLGLPLIVFAFIAFVLIVRRKIIAEKMLWGIIFASWAAFFLFAIVSPYAGLVIGWPNRFPYFVSMPLAMLAGLAINWFEDHIPSLLGKTVSHRRLITYLILTVVMLSTLVQAADMGRFVYYPYANEIQVSERLGILGLKADERIASFGTLSYVFNVVSDGWQLDGGYSQGQVNPDFYYRYWLTLTTDDNVSAILKTLNETNTRYVIFPQGSHIPSPYLNQTFFDQDNTNGFTIFSLKDNYPLNFVEVTSGHASVSYSHPNPDELFLTVQDCSEGATLVVKMNYYPCWTAYPSRGEAKLTKDTDGLMKIEIHGADSLSITLQYGSTLIDNVALGVTLMGTVAYLLMISRSFLRGPNRWNHTRHKGSGIENPKTRKNGKNGQQNGSPKVKALESQIDKSSLKGFPSTIIDALLMGAISAFSFFYVLPYVTIPGVPMPVDTQGHLFKVWYILDALSKYGKLPMWIRFGMQDIPFSSSTRHSVIH